MKRYHATETPLITRIESFISAYATLADSTYLLPLALWTVGTFLYPTFDAFPYIVITSATKRSGKTRLSELLAFTCATPRQFGAMTPATLFNSMDNEKPTIFFDEAEVLSSESASTMRAVLNMGYRKGQAVPRMVNGSVKEFPTYCPKVFILIGDVYDTLKDRSIVVRMKRATPAERFTFDSVRAAGDALRAEIAAATAEASDYITERYLAHSNLDFLTDRDEELWLPLFSIASMFCPERMDELSRCAVDIATEKTQAPQRYVNLLGQEQAAEDDEYATRLLRDVSEVIGTHHHMTTAAILAALHAIPTAPWRKYRGTGLTMHNLSDMLSRFGVAPRNIRIGARAANTVRKGYTRKSLDKALAAHS